MIINVSGRCDIPAYFSEWLMNRLNEGYVDVRNPIYEKSVSRIYFEDVDLIVFCSKNPIPMVDKLDDIKIPILFHVTITPYKKDIEVNVPDKRKIIEAVKEISKKIGKDRVFVRYDPVFINDKYTLEYHIRAFDRLCALLDGYVEHIIISFIDEYKNVRRNQGILKIKNLTKRDYQEIGINFYNSAKKHHMTVQTCSEEENLVEYGFIDSSCVDISLAFKITGKTKFKRWKSRNNKYCNCVEMVDIGHYNLCGHSCRYCYANYDAGRVIENMKLHDPKSSLIVGYLKSDDVIKIRK